MDSIDTTTLDAITGKIKICLGNIETCFNNIVINILEVGNQLIQAKSMIPHGDWQNWLTDNFNMTIRSAQYYMRVAKKFSKNERVFAFQPSSLKELAKLAEPDMDSFIAENPDAPNLPTRKLRDRIKEWKASKELAKTAHEKEIVTIDATPQILNPQALELLLFDDLPKLPPIWTAPQEIISAAEKMKVGLTINFGSIKVAEIFSPSIVITAPKTGTLWFSMLVAKAAAVCFAAPMHFVNPAGKSIRKTCAICYFGDEVENFTANFWQFGWIHRS